MYFEFETNNILTCLRGSKFDSYLFDFETGGVEPRICACKKREHPASAGANSFEVAMYEAFAYLTYLPCQMSRF